MMKRIDRINFFKKIAQNVPPAQPATTTPPTTTAPATPAPIITIQSLPKYRPNLLTNVQRILPNLNEIVAKINQTMWRLSNGTVSFNIVHTAPSITGSEYSNSLKNLVSLSKSIYDGMLTPTNLPPFTAATLVAKLKSITTDLATRSYPEAPQDKADIKRLIDKVITMLGGQV